jgi:lysozyme
MFLSKRTLAALGTSAVVGLALPFTLGFEGVRNTPYVDPVGIKTVCAGHTAAMGPITQAHYTDAQCVAMAASDLSKEQREFEAKYPQAKDMTPEQEAMLIDAVHNMGMGTFDSGSLPGLIREENFDGACARLLQYDKGRIDGRLFVLPGLERRRVAEYDVCTGRKTATAVAAENGVTVE